MRLLEPVALGSAWISIPRCFRTGSPAEGPAFFTSGRYASLALKDDRGSTFVDGDLIVDGWLENVGALVFVRGNVIAQTLFISGNLVILGELCVRRLFGEDE